MWPIIKKELRENAPYLLGAFVIILLILDFAAFDYGWILLGVPLLLGDRADLLANASKFGFYIERIEGTWAFLCFLLAGAIAWGQVYHERRRKTWPLLAHLPMPRSRMIFAKVLAGLLMYLIVFLPLALLIIARLNTPGVWPGPIYANMFLPLLAYFLAGAMLYLAAFLSAFRSARWYATKWFPLVTAIAAYSTVELARGFLSQPFYYWQQQGISPLYMFSLLFNPAAALLSLVLVLWAIGEQARTREY